MEIKEFGPRGAHVPGAPFGSATDNKYIHCNSQHAHETSSQWFVMATRRRV